MKEEQKEANDKVRAEELLVPISESRSASFVWMYVLDVRGGERLSICYATNWDVQNCDLHNSFNKLRKIRKKQKNKTNILARLDFIHNFRFYL